MIPTLEGRYAILILQPTFGTPIIPTYIVATLVGFLPSPFIIILIEKVLHIFCTSKIKPLNMFGNWLSNKVNRAKHKINRIDSTEKIKELNASNNPKDHKKAEKLQKQMDEQGGSFGIWSFVALMIFVAIPLPGTGVWTGSMAAGVLNMRLKDALPPIFVGNIIAGLITTLIATGLIPAFI